MVYSLGNYRATEDVLDTWPEIQSNKVNDPNNSWVEKEAGCGLPFGRRGFLSNPVLCLGELTCNLPTGLRPTGLASPRVRRVRLVVASVLTLTGCES